MAEVKLEPCILAAWQELIERDDRTSPAEYPEMALITRDELAEFMRRAIPPHDALVKALRAWRAFDASPGHIETGDACEWIELARNLTNAALTNHGAGDDKQ